MSLFQHVPHPHVEARRQAGPVKVDDQRRRAGRVSRANAWLGLKITTVVGTMYCAYAFTLWAIYGLPSAVKQGPSGLVLWGSSELAQLVLLPVIIVGQNLQARAADARSDQTFKDAEAILAECLELQRHLAEQDRVISQTAEHAERLATELGTKP